MPSVMEINKIPVVGTVDYPPEVVDRWRKNAEITKLKIASGEIKYKTVDEIAAELGINLD